jgi:hypothetical protein
MKTWKQFTLTAILAVFAITFTFTACFSDWSGEGTFSITIGGSANNRAVSWYENSNNFIHTITVNGNGQEQTKKGIKANETVSFSVTPGNWNISVVADLEGKKCAEGYNSVEIKSGQNRSVTIKMYPYYKIGDEGPAEGIIFYTNPNYKSDGWRYLEAARTNIMQNDGGYTFRWGTEYKDENSNDVMFAVDSTQERIGTGKGNTKRIVDAIIEKNLVDRNYAAYVASSIINDFDDWFLPSIDELKEMYNNLHDLGDFGTDEPYWSSSELNNDVEKVLVLYFADNDNFDIKAGEPKSLQKVGNGYVRAIRQF